MGRLEIRNPRRGCGRVRPCLDRISLEADAVVGENASSRETPVAALENEIQTWM